MKLVVNTTASLFRLNARAYGRLIALGTKVKPHNQDDGTSEPGEIVIFDNAEPGVIISDNPDDAGYIYDGNAHIVNGWLHTDCRYYDTVLADEMWTRADPNLIRVVEELGEHAGQMGCIPKVITIPDDIDSWSMGSENGMEVVFVRRGNQPEVVWHA